MITSYDESISGSEGILVKGGYLKNSIHKPNSECHYEADGDLTGAGVDSLHPPRLCQVMEMTNEIIIVHTFQVFLN
ncbi:MAG: hypothetical protein KKB51_13895 [Candidatus Riflebacteria bacterium]|nr:hypothetical protein [Candidatus Riflebacteria bacterium]